MIRFQIEKTRRYEPPYMQDQELSIKARGMLNWLISESDDWDLTMQGLLSLRSEGHDFISGCLRELEDLGYLTKKRERDSRGRWGTTVYMVHDWRVSNAERIAEGGAPAKSLDFSLVDKSTENPQKAQNEEKPVMEESGFMEQKSEDVFEDDPDDLDNADEYEPDDSPTSGNEFWGESDLRTPMPDEREPSAESVMERYWQSRRQSMEEFPDEFDDYDRPKDDDEDESFFSRARKGLAKSLEKRKK